MKSGVDYWLGQLLSLIFYIMTIIVYNRARREYVGGKIAAAINLIMVFLAILLLTDFVDYFLVTLVPLGDDIITILKILLKLIAICVLFFGGLRFFTTKSDEAEFSPDEDLLDGIDTALPRESESGPVVDQNKKETVVLQDIPQKKPTLGRYEIIEQIGKGAMGIVYKGRDPKLNRLTAIKTIRFMDEFDEDKVEQIKDQFYREAEVVARLSHKNIVTIYDVGEDLDLSYLAMEYLEGESLEKYTPEDKLLPIEKCIDYLIQVCEALNCAHGMGIVHRDIKPGNIMVMKNGLVKVTDFGIARAAGGTKTRTGIIKGTPFYMSPEQAKGEVATGASDIFSLGVLFYQLLTGKLPFTGENLATIMYQSANVDPEPASTYNPNLDQGVLDILKRALEKNPQDRFDTAGEMAEALRQLLSVYTPIGRDADSATSIKSLEAEEKEPLQEDSIGFAELEKVMLEETIADEDREQAFIGTEDLPEEQTPDVRGYEEGTGEQKRLDLTALREVIAARKKRIAQSGEDARGEGAYQVVQTTPPHDGEKDVRPDEDQADWKSEKFIPYRMKGRKGPKPKFILQVVYIFITLIVLGGAYYYFWHSPNAENRLLKLVYYEYFESEQEKQQKMMAEQKRLVQEIMKKKLEEKQRQAQLENEKNKQAQQEAAAADEKRKEQQKIAEQKIEEEKRKEAERLAKIEAEKREEEKRKRRIEAEKKKEAERQAKIAEEKRKERERKEKLARDKIEAAIQKEINFINGTIKEAEEYEKKKEYLKAKNNYESALKSIDGSYYKNDERLVNYRNDIIDRLTSDEIVFGSKGYIFYKEQWLSPNEYEAQLYKEGFVKYQGEFREYRTLTKTIKNKTRPVVETFVIEKFKDQVVHAKQIKYQTMTLKTNTNTSSGYTVSFKWEVWTFKGLNEGMCNLEIVYRVDKDKWYLIRGCE